MSGGHYTSDDILMDKYGSKTNLQLMQALDQEKAAREKAEASLYHYQEAFAWLEGQVWFANNRNTLSKWWKSTHGDKG